MKIKKLLSILIAVCMLSGVAACGETEGGGDNPAGDDGKATADSGGVRTIVLGTWFDRYYVSKHSSIYDNPEVNEPEKAELELANMRKIEETYGIKFDYINLTWEGIQESIVTSIMAGLPDCDIYQVETSFGVPAVLGGMAVSLESMNLQDTDVFNDQLVMKYLNVGQPESYLFKDSLSSSIPNYPLAFNLDMILNKGLENPQDLWDRGEWTWDKWREYLIALTDVNNGIYGWSGYWKDALNNLLFSNGTTVASGATTSVTDTATIEVFDLFYTIYNVEKTARPWDESEWTINNKMYADGKSAFWVGADWIFQEFGGAELPFEIGVVPWPVGPSGDKDTNKHGSIGGNWYMIPRGVENPRLVYDVMFDWLNWYDYDTELAEDTEWVRNQYMTERNYEYADMMHKNSGFDIWQDIGLGDSFSMVEIMSGEKTAAQYAEEVKQLIQESLDKYYG